MTTPTTAAIICPSGHRHDVPAHFAECWLDADRVREVPVTQREFDVASELLKRGDGNRAIGRRLFLSEDTVKSHMKKLLLRTGAGSRTELIVAVFRGRVRLVPVPIAATLYWSTSKQGVMEGV